MQGAENLNIILELAAIGVAVIGGIGDWKRRKIPNRLTFPVMLAGLAGNLVLRGGAGLLDSAAGIGTGFLVFFLFAIGALKAGDVKLYMAVGAVAGWRFCGDTIIWSILLGGAAALLLMASRRTGRRALKNLWLYFVNLLYTRKFRMYQPESELSYFSFGCCIAAGAAAAFFCPVL